MWQALVVLALGAACWACSSGDDKKPDPAPQPPPQPQPKPQCDNFVKEQSLWYVDQDSFDAFNLFWPGNVNASRFSEWRPDARLHFGAAEELFRPTCDKRGEVMKGPALRDLVSEAAKFFAANYSKVPENSEQGAILFLAGGLATTTEMDRESTYIAYDNLAKENPAHKGFAELMKAWWWFNKAVEKADNRFSAPKAGVRMNAKDRADAKEALDEMDKVLKDVKDLDDKEYPYMRVLRDAAEGFRKSLGGGPGRGRVKVKTGDTGWGDPDTSRVK